MQSAFPELQVLVDLGLTLKQARVYLTLTKHGTSKVLTISKLSKVARADLYQVLLKLEEQGLVEKIIKKPIEYRAISLKKGLSFLMEEKTKHYEKIRAEAEKLRQLIELEKPNDDNQTDTSQFVYVSKGRAIIEKIRNSIENAQESVDVVLSWKRFSSGIAGAFGESVENAWTRKVKTRFIVEHPLEKKTTIQLIQACREKPSFQIKFIRNYPRIIFGIYDNREVSIAENPKVDLSMSAGLWSNNPSLIALAEDHFEVLWLKALEELDFRSCHSR